MSKSITVALAVGSQLHHEGRWPPNNLNNVMGEDYRYNVNTLSLFLTAVKWNLEHGKPSYIFDFDNNFVSKALSMTVGTLTGAIDAQAK